MAFLTYGVEVAVQAGPLVLVLAPPALELHAAAGDGDGGEGEDDAERGGPHGDYSGRDAFGCGASWRLNNPQ